MNHHQPQKPDRADQTKADQTQGETHLMHVQAPDQPALTVSDLDELRGLRAWRQRAEEVAETWQRFADQLDELLAQLPCPVSLLDEDGQRIDPFPAGVRRDRMAADLRRTLAGADSVAAAYTSHVARLDVAIGEQLAWLNDQTATTRRDAAA